MLVPIGDLHEKIASLGIKIHGLSLHDGGIEIDFQKEVTDEEKATAQQLVDAFDTGKTSSQLKDEKLVEVKVEDTAMPGIDSEIDSLVDLEEVKTFLKKLVRYMVR